jgi:HAMP domain-containing protein
MEREDEIGQLAQVFNRMTQQLQVSFNHLEEIVK